MSGQPKYISKIKGKPFTLVSCGLDFAGKTAMFQYLLTGELREDLEPTVDFNIEKFTLAGGLLEATIFDMGGQKSLRSQWQDQIMKADGILYVVDANDPGRFSESKEEFHNRVLPIIPDKPCCILANKYDLIIEKKQPKWPMALIKSVSNEVQKALEVPKVEKSRQFKLITTSMKNGLGLNKIFRFFLDF
ncbi:MAG: ADP-ribosylation factor-like protein [Promethearchaeota archaeon]